MSTREKHSFKLRLTENIYNKIQESSKNNGRSMTSEILLRLGSSYGISLYEQNNDAENNLQTIKLYEIEKELNNLKSRVSKIETIEHLRKI